MLCLKLYRSRTDLCGKKACYSRLPITRTFKGNRKKFELSGVRVIGSSKKIAGSKEKINFHCTVNILMLSENLKILLNQNLNVT